MTVNSAFYTVSELLYQYHHPELAEVYLDALAMLHDLEYTVIDEHLNTLVTTSSMSDGTVVSMEVNTIFDTCISAAILEHGIVFDPSKPFLVKYNFLKELLAIGAHEDTPRLLDVLDTYNDPIDTLTGLLIEIGSTQYDDYTDGVMEICAPFFPNMRTYFEANSPAIPLFEVNPLIELAKNRLNNVPSDIKKKSIMYSKLEDGLGLAYVLDNTMHSVLSIVLSECVSSSTMLDEVRIFLLASALYDEELLAVFHKICENMLPDGLASQLIQIREVGYPNV